jgi:hypothetical protein
LIDILPADARSTAAVVGIWGVLLTAVITAIKAWPALRKLQLESDASLRGDLLARVGALEAEVIELRKALERERHRHADEMEDVRHELNNETQSLDAFILLAEANPERVIDQLPKIKEMRARHRERVALRRGARSAAQSPETQQ